MIILSLIITLFLIILCTGSIFLYNHPLTAIFGGQRLGRVKTKQKIKQKNGSKPKKDIDRRHEVLEASKKIPLELLKLTPPRTRWAGSFDLVDGKLVPMYTPAPGIYFYINIVREDSYESALTPFHLKQIHYLTSGGQFAWCVVFSYECSYLIRMDPVDGKIPTFNIKQLLKWFKKNLYGSPPHKLVLEDYIKFLKTKMGFTIHTGKRYDGRVRLTRRHIESESKSKKEIERLSALTQEDFDHMDWSEYDEKVGNLVYSSNKESYGDIDIVKHGNHHKIIVYKIYSGLPFAAPGSYRTYVGFHTHPNNRFDGQSIERPSTADLNNVLSVNYDEDAVWSLVAASEGTYILRASELLKNMHKHNKDDIASVTKKIYAMDQYLSAELSIQDTLNKLKEIGYIAYFHRSKKNIVSTLPNVTAIENSMIRKHVIEEYESTKLMNANDIITADWSDFFNQVKSSRVVSSSFSGVSIKKGKVFTTIGGHVCNMNKIINGDIPSNYGPILSIYLPYDQDLPRSVPIKCIHFIEEHSDVLTWMVFISPKNILAFRVVNDQVDYLFGAITLPK